MGTITLLTDFGHRDNYVGVMKGVIAGISPQSQLIDITHAIKSQDILAARFNLLTSYGYFPAGTIHIVIVDPGVGTQRSAIAAQIATSVGVHTVIAPDNGIITGLPVTAAVALTNQDYWRTPHASHTFHGRDIFAPAAAHLARGISFGQLGVSLSVSNLVGLDIDDVAKTNQGYCGCIQYSDHFGNLVTNIPGARLSNQTWHIYLGKHCIPNCTTYGLTEVGSALALVGSHGYVEIAVNGGNAAEILNGDVGDSVELSYALHGLGRGAL
ncbi:MAG: S-adenosyl-l-methionine hydroxide adenosyltransferase family protein [Leptolyngbyaceae cyanobacterium]